MNNRYMEAVCKRGHVVDFMLNPQVGQGNTPPPFCNDCGAIVMTRCSNCNDPIWGGERGSFPPSRPGNFCTACGGPFPWVGREAIAHHLENLLEGSSDLDARQQLELKEQIAVQIGRA